MPTPPRTNPAAPEQGPDAATPQTAGGPTPDDLPDDASDHEAAARAQSVEDRQPKVLAARVLQGMAMGGADVIPGVSGGTVALILGIYTRLIGSIRTLSKGQVTRVPWLFVLPVALGLVMALGIGSVVLPPLLESQPVIMSALFVGMIIASLSVPWREAIADREMSARARWGVAVAAAVAAFLVMGLPAAAVVDQVPLWRVFLSASVAICAMILPGVSGAFLLVALGVYEPTLEALSGGDLPYIGTFVLGAVIGLGLFSRLLSRLLEHKLGITMAALTGLMVGALRVLWPWGGEEGRFDAPAGGADAVEAAIAAAVGFALVRLLLRSGRKAEVRA